MTSSSDDLKDDLKDDLEIFVSEVADEVISLGWDGLASHLPRGDTVVRPAEQGPYMSVRWDASWQRNKGGPILVKVTGFLDSNQEDWIWITGAVIHRKRSWRKPFARQ